MQTVGTTIAHAAITDEPPTGLGLDYVLLQKADRFADGAAINPINPCGELAMLALPQGKNRALLAQFWSI